MAKQNAKLTVEGMSCQHCVNSVQKAVGELKGVHEVIVDLQGKSVSVSYEADAVTLAAIKEAIEDQGYDVK